jgi:alpha-mannosidase
VYRELPIIEGEIRLHWIGGRKALKLALPLAVDDGTATYEVAYGCCERPADGSEQPAQQWADLTGHLRTAGQPAPVYGVALLNDGKYGYDARPSELRMTLLRSPVFAHHDPSKLDPSGDYRYTDQGEQVVRYRLVPHVGPACAQALARRAMELNVAPITVNEFQHGGPLPAACAFAQVEPEAIVATVCKEAEDGDGLIFRAYESVGQAVTATITMPVLGLTWQPEFRPMQIRTWRVRPGHTTPITEVDALEAA